MWKHKESKWLVKGGRKVRCYLCGKKILAKGDLFLFHQDTGYYSHQSCQAESSTISGNERRRAVKKIAVGAAVVGAIAAGAGKFLDVSSQSKNSPAAQTILTSQGLIPPALTSDPANPVPGQMWYRSDAGVMAHFDGVQNRVIYSNRIVDGSAVVTSKGIVNGLSVLPNDGQDWGPDTTKGATAPGQYGSPYTETGGMNELCQFILNNPMKMVVLPGFYLISNQIGYATSFNGVAAPFEIVGFATNENSGHSPSSYNIDEGPTIVASSDFPTGKSILQVGNTSGGPTWIQISGLQFYGTSSQNINGITLSYATDTFVTRCNLSQFNNALSSIGPIRVVECVLDASIVHVNHTLGDGANFVRNHHYNDVSGLTTTHIYQFNEVGGGGGAVTIDGAEMASSGSADMVYVYNEDVTGGSYYYSFNNLTVVSPIAININLPTNDGNRQFALSNCWFTSSVTTLIQLAGSGDIVSLTGSNCTIDYGNIIFIENASYTGSIYTTPCFVGGAMYIGGAASSDIPIRFKGITSTATNAFAAVGVTVGASPFTYTNTGFFDELILIAGGTVTAIAITRNTGFDGSTSAPNSSTLKDLFPNTQPILLPGDTITITYSSAPSVIAEELW